MLFSHYGQSSLIDWYRAESGKAFDNLLILAEIRIVEQLMKAAA
jgi:hypothetical protein